MVLSFSKLERKIYGSGDKALDAIKSMELDPETGAFMTVTGQRGIYPLTDCLYQDRLLFNQTGAKKEGEKGKGINLMGLKVVSEDGTSLGQVTDFYFDTELFQLLRFVCSQKFLQLFPQNRIIDRKNIVRITHQKIVIKNTLQPKEERTSSAAIEISPA